ncbi:hypothetical protein [Shewanella surugensis]|uniref:Uncharacterized protein n=1 Tax=Shewanella surugensis TaxID=212020 RepID=A0ABT0LG99_9GAMM|nr:hypothetical protein [Shewanella surugensis]MCL1126201.1 hypothetical protein [Shewanella surugensis]
MANCQRPLAIGLFFITNMASAAGYLTSLGNPEATITSVFTHAEGHVTLIVSGVTLNPDECGDLGRVHIQADLPGHKNLVSAALTAFASGKKVGFYTTGCEVIPFWGGTSTRPVINSLWIK